MAMVKPVAALALLLAVGSPNRAHLAGKGGQAFALSSPQARSAGQDPAVAATQALRCRNGRGYFNYHEPLLPGALTLASLFDGRGKVQPVASAETLSFDLGPLKARADPISDNRTQAIPYRGSYYSVQRLHQSAGPRGRHWNLFLFKSDDGVSFRLVPGSSPSLAILPPSLLGPSGEAYDAHISVDYCSGPFDRTRPGAGLTFIMTFECYGIPGLPPGGNVCQSTSNDISNPNSWSRPRAVFTTSDPAHVASGYPTTLWTGGDNHALVYAAATREIRTPATAREATKFIPSPVDYRSVVPIDVARTPYLMESLPLATCSRPEARSRYWDCNNRVVTDWKREGDAYYVAYVGANYFDSVLPRRVADMKLGLPRTRQEVDAKLPYLPFAQYGSSDKAKIARNRWGFSFARVTGSPLQSIVPGQRSAEMKVDAPITDADFAGISSPTVNVVGGRMYVYYSVYERERGQLVGKVKRSRIVPR